MSHFSMLVVTENNSNEDLEKALQPYHEYECTGINDEYVQWVDHTDEVVKEYAEEGRAGVQLPDGRQVCETDKVFYRDPTREEKERIGPMAGMGCGHGMSWASEDWGDGRGYRTRILDRPENLPPCTIPFKTLYPSLEAFVKDWHGYTVERRMHEGQETTRIGRYTNPNAKWDWWVPGGRYNCKLQLRPDEVIPSYDKSQPGFNCLQMKRLDTSKLTAFGILLDGEWIEQGSMGWWAIVTDEKSEQEWEKIFQATLARINPEHYVTVVDCHI
jgi:hypothetical protein